MVMKLQVDPRTVISVSRQNQAINKAKQNDPEALKKATQDFEAIFIQSMFKAMRKTIPEGGLFERDTAHEIYQDMMDAEVATEISRRQSLGLADQMYRQIDRMLEDKKP